MINYSCTLGQDIMRLGFESIKMIKDVLFTSYLIKKTFNSPLWLIQHERLL